MGKSRIGTTCISDGRDRELLIRYLEYVLVDIAAISPPSAHLLQQAIERLHPGDPDTTGTRLRIN